MRKHTTSPMPKGRDVSSPSTHGTGTLTAVGVTAQPACVGTDHVNLPVWLREPQAAEALGFAPGTLRQWRHHGRGPAFHKVGRSVLYARDELHRFVSAGRVETNAA